MIKGSQRQSKVLFFDHVDVYDTNNTKNQCIAQNCTVQFLDSNPFPKLLIEDLGLYWLLSPQRFSKNKSLPFTFDYKFNKNKYTITFQANQAKTLQKYIKTNDDMIILEQKMTDLNFTTQFFSAIGTLQKPNKKQKVQIKIMQGKDKICYIIIDDISYAINDDFDFKFDKFNNTLTWYNETQQRAYKISLDDFTLLTKLQKNILDVFNRHLQMEEVRSGTGINNQSDLFADLGDEDIYQRLFFNVPQFAGSVIKGYEQKMEVEYLDVGQRLPSMVNQKSEQITTGNIIMSYSYNYLIAIKNQFMCIYIPSATGISKHNQVFVASHPTLGQITPLDIHYSKDQKCIIFKCKGVNYIGSYDIENNVIIEVLQIPCKKQILQFKTSDKIKFYSITENQIIETQFNDRKLSITNRRPFNKNWILRCLTITPQRSISTGSTDGIIRLYSAFDSKKSLNNLNIAKQVVDLSFSADHTILISATKRKIFMYVFPKDPFVKRLSNQQKIGTYLKFNQQDRQKYGVKSFNFQKARLIINDSYVVACSDKLLILWQVKKVLNNFDNSYKIIDMKQKILGFEVMTDKSLIVNLDKNIEIVNII